MSEKNASSASPPLPPPLAPISDKTRRKMSSVFPYTYYSCSCVDTTSSPAVTASGQETEDIDDEGGTFNPKSPRANFSLFPIEHLLYCTECHQVRCPRCITEEVVCWYCPGCLFEVPSSTVRSEGNRYRMVRHRQIALPDC